MGARHAWASSPAHNRGERTWFDKNPGRTTTLYFESQEQRQALQQQARDEGYGRFSKWLIDKVTLGASDEATDRRYIANLEAQVEKREAAVAPEREVAERYRQQVDALTAEIQAYARRFASLAQATEAP